MIKIEPPLGGSGRSQPAAGSEDFWQSASGSETSVPRTAKQGIEYRDPSPSWKRGRRGNFLAVVPAQIVATRGIQTQIAPCPWCFGQHWHGGSSLGDGDTRLPLSWLSRVFYLARTIPTILTLIFSSHPPKLLVSSVAKPVIRARKRAWLDFSESASLVQTRRAAPPHAILLVARDGRSR